jgi:hypothetical protein
MPIFDFEANGAKKLKKMQNYANYIYKFVPFATGDLHGLRQVANIFEN